jgi:hypothetical protein
LEDLQELVAAERGVQDMVEKERRIGEEMSRMGFLDSPVESGMNAIEE